MKAFMRAGLAIAILGASTAVWAQTTGSIVGTVKDPSGGVVPSCQVQATATDTKETQHAVCNSSGYYVFPVLRPAPYSITISASGFGDYINNAAVLQANQALTVNATLAVASVSQQVTVSSAPTQVNTTNGTISTVIDRAQILDLPLNGRNVAQLTTLVAGAVSAPDARATQGLTIPDDVTISTNGTRGNQISYRLDGANNTDELTNVNAPFPFPDALQEYSVQTSNYSAQYGDSSGAAVNIVTKSGTNQFHGDLFEYVRNSAFNARNYFATSVDNLHRNQFGGTLGGPVIFPHYNGRKRTFFFVGYQATRLANTSHGNVAFVPTTLERIGNFSASPVKPINPSTGQLYPGDQLPYIDPVTKNFYKYVPNGGATGRIVYSLPDNENTNEVVARGDQMLGAKDQLTARYFYYGYSKQAAFPDNNLFALTTGRSIPSTNAILEETHTFSANLLNEARFDYQRIAGLDTTPSGVPNAKSLGEQVNQDPLPSTIDGISTNEWSLGAAWPVAWVRNQFEGSDDLQWVHGHNNFAFGIRVERDRYDNTNTFGERPASNFYGDFTGNDYADLDLGLENNFNQSTGQFIHNRTTHVSFYGQDDIHLASNFTLNVGVRYEPFFPWDETQNEIQAFNLKNFQAGIRSTVFPNAPPGMIFPGDKGFLNDGVGDDLTNVSPRVGFAWDVHGNGKTSIHGGGGAFYEARQVMVANQVLIPAPFSNSITLIDQGTFSNPYLGTTDPFPYTNLGYKDKNFVFQNPLAVYTYDQGPGKFQTPVTYNWNLTLEQQLTNNNLLRISYVGSRSNHEMETFNVDPARYIPGSTLSLNARRIIQGYSAIDEIRHDVNASYNSLQVSFIRRATKNLTFSANYTWSKSLDDLPYSAAVNSAAINPVLPIYVGRGFHALDYGPSDWDRTNVFSASYVWILPKLTSGQRVVRAVVNGWETTGIVSAESGDPITVTASGNVSQTGQNSDRAVIVGPAYGTEACIGQPLPCVGYLNPAGFASPATGRFGDVVKGSFRGPRYFDWDTGVFRNFPIANKATLQFRAEYFNVLNHTNLDDVDGLNNDVNGGGFGQINTADDPRIGQMALTLTF
ncbi:MAG: carboxypeptidase regulatory-like domain-containing protein [Acidobacteriaceae bacterium]